MSATDAVLRVLSPKQLDAVVNSTARINVLHGAVSSGKTVASLLRFLHSVANAPDNALIFIVGRTLQTIERNVIDVLMQRHGPFGPFAGAVQHTRGANVATILGRTVYLVGANDVRAEGRIRGSTASVIYIDEGTLIPEAFFTMSLSRLRVPGAHLIVTTNADAPGHYLRKKFLLNPALNLRQWQFGIDDNPALPAEHKADLKQEYTGLFYRRFILGEWRLAEGAVFDMFDTDRHVVDHLPPIVAWIGCGVDYGTVNPFAAVVLGLGADGRLYAAAEWYYNSKVKLRQLTDHEYSERLRLWLATLPVPHSDPPLLGIRPQWMILDPSAASFRLQLHQDGVVSRLGDNAVLPGLRTLASLFSTGRLKIHSSCTSLISELPGYSWDPEAARRGTDAPIKTEDHAIDALRYVVVTTEAIWRNRLCEPNTDLLTARTSP